MRIMGLDEAGRGCVIGPLFVGGFVTDDGAPLKAAGAADSKTLSQARRLAAKARLAPLGTGVTVAISCAQIDAGNVNALEEAAFIDLVRSHRPDFVYLDAPVHPRGIPALRARLIAATGVSEWIVEPKADVNYPVVGAASIYAKLAREAELERIAAEVAAAGHGPLGSGYPSDPETRRYILRLLAMPPPLPSHVRARWGTLQRLGQQSLF